MRRQSRRLIGSVFGAAAAFCAAQAPADVRMPGVFGDNMVVQQKMPVKVWGWASPGESVAVSFGGAEIATIADAKGEWKLELPARQASSTPEKMTVKGSNEIVFDNVLVGEVWLCAGQSNMMMGIGGVDGGREAAAAADCPGLRLLTVPAKMSVRAQRDFAPSGKNGKWLVCTPKNVAEGSYGWGGFPSVAFIFGRELHKELGVPVGLVAAAWGGSSIEPWMPVEGLAKFPKLEKYYKAQLDELKQRAALSPEACRAAVGDYVAATVAWGEKAKQESANGKEDLPPPPAAPKALQPLNSWLLSVMHNGMVAPMAPFAVRGAVWYQGESNVSDGDAYVEKAKALVEGWKALWGQPDLAYYLVQLPPFVYKGKPDTKLPEFWAAQLAVSRELPNSGIACTMDVGNLKDIHPLRKIEVGRRLALQALAKTYGKKDIVADGPVFKSVAYEGGKAAVSFDNVASGLKSSDGKALSWFELSADGKGFAKADAKIEGDKVIVSASGIDRPVAVRFAWSQAAEPNLVNAAGLPAYPFSTK